MGHPSLLKSGLLDLLPRFCFDVRPHAASVRAPRSQSVFFDRIPFSLVAELNCGTCELGEI